MPCGPRGCDTIPKVLDMSVNPCTKRRANDTFKDSLERMRWRMLDDMRVRKLDQKWRYVPGCPPKGTVRPGAVPPLYRGVYAEPKKREKAPPCGCLKNWQTRPCEQYRSDCEPAFLGMARGGAGQHCRTYKHPVPIEASQPAEKCMPEFSQRLVAEDRSLSPDPNDWNTFRKGRYAYFGQDLLRPQKRDEKPEYWYRNYD